MRFLLYILIAGCVNSISAQKLTLTVSPKLDIKNGDGGFQKYLHHDATGHYILLAHTVNRLKNPIDFVVFQKHNEQFKQVVSTDIDMDDRFTTFDTCFYAGNKFMLCTHKEDKSENRFTYFTTLINMDGTLKKPQKISSLTWKDKDDKPAGTTWLMSEDTTKLLLATYADDNDASLKTRVNIAVHSNSLEKIWSKNVALPYDQDRFVFDSWTVDNSGNVYLLCKIYDENTKKLDIKIGRSERPYRIKVLRFDQTATKPKEFNVDIGGKFATDVSFKLTSQGDLNCVGFYSDDRKMIAQGFFFTRLDRETGAPATTSKKAFDEKNLPLLSTGKDKSGDEGLSSTFKFNHVIARKDGSTVVTAENTFVRSSTSYNTGGFGGVGINSANATTYNVYYNLDIFVVSISPAGDIEWVRSIPKSQVYSRTNLFNSYALMATADDLYFLYTDSEANIARPLTEKPRMFDALKGAAAALVTIDRAGNMTRKRAFDAAETRINQIIPRHSAQTKPDELFFLGWSLRGLSNNFHLGRINID